MFKKILFSLMVVFVASGNLVFAGGTRYLSFEQTSKSDQKVFNKGVSSHFEMNRMDDPYFIVSSIKVTEIDAFDAKIQEVKATNNPFSKDLGEVIASLDKMMALGTKVWKIIEEGKPVINVNMQATPISIIPFTDKPKAVFYEMEHWSAPRARRYRIEYTNLLGMNVISFDYTVSFQYNGQYESTGRYVTGLEVVASNVAVSWGYEFDASSQLKTISNRGSLDSPIAGGTIQINYVVKSTLRNISSSETFHVTGAGEILKY